LLVSARQTRLKKRHYKTHARPSMRTSQSSQSSNDQLETSAVGLLPHTDNESVRDREKKDRFCFSHASLPPLSTLFTQFVCIPEPMKRRGPLVDFTGPIWMCAIWVRVKDSSRICSASLLAISSILLQPGDSLWFILRVQCRHPACFSFHRIAP